MQILIACYDDCVENFLLLLQCLPCKQNKKHRHNIHLGEMQNTFSNATLLSWKELANIGHFKVVKTSLAILKNENISTENEVSILCSSPLS